METADLLTKLTELQDKNEKNTNAYISVMRDFISSTAGQDWDYQHEILFNSMEKRVKDARIIKWILTLTIIITFSIIAFFGIYRSFLSTEIKKAKALIEFARNTSLPLEIVKMDTTGQWLNVNIARRFEDFTSKQQEELNRMIETFPTLGRIYDLSENKSLNVSIESGEIGSDNLYFYISPSNSSSKLGRLKPVYNSGLIWPSTGSTSEEANQFQQLKTPIEYISKSNAGLNFYLKINEYNRLNGKWQIQFREGEKEWSKIFYINKSLKGALGSQTIRVTEPGWSGIYAVNIGIGPHGYNRDGEYAWNVRTTVEQVIF